MSCQEKKWLNLSCCTVDCEIDAISVLACIQKQYWERLRYFVDGVVPGSEEFVRDYLQMLKKEGYYLRRKNPIPQRPGPYATLREQRSQAFGW